MSHRLTKEELDEQFELFLKESVSDDSDKQPGAKSSQKPAQKPTVSWWEDDEHSDGGTERGLLRSGKTFRKSLRRSVRVEDESPADSGLKEDGLEAAVISRDSLELEDSVMVPAANTTSIGLDTIEEEEDKARFFAQLEAGALSTIDYSKLNRELDSTSSTTGTNLRRAEEMVEQSSDDQRKASITETPGSPHYSEDFEKEENGEEPLEEKSKMSPILAKVSLHDSLDDTGGEDHGKGTAGSLDKGQSYVHSGASEMEALHEAYRQIHVVEDSDDHSPHHLVKGRGRINRPESPSSPPQHATQSLQPASTNDSDLPTAEALMRPIRPEKDHIRGFTLQPVSEKTSRFLERTFSDVTSPESQLERPEETDPIPEIQAARGLTSHLSSSPDPPNLTWSIRQEVERLIQDPSKSSHTSLQTGKAKKQQASHGSTVTHSSSSPVRKPAVRGSRVEGRRAGTSRSSGLSISAATAKTKSSGSLPLQHPQEKAKFRKSQENDADTEPGVKVNRELVASVQSLVDVLQKQTDTIGHQDAADTQDDCGPPKTRLTYRLHNNNREQDSCLVEELRVQLAQREMELQMMKEDTEELKSLRQQNYLLKSKLRSAEEASRRERWAEATDSAAEEKLQQIDKEMEEQERLIKGYQQENEKLYLQMKTQRAESKANEEAMFNENERLLSELAFTRVQLTKTPRTVGDVMDHTQRITDMLAQIKTFQKNEAELSEDIHRLKQEKRDLEEELQLMRKDRDLAIAQGPSVSGDKTLEMRVLEDKHREEVAALKKKLQRFAENQELLDRDAGRLKAATAEIQQLKEQVAKLSLVGGKSSSEQKRRAKEKTVETKRIQELQQQVKELKQILRRTNSNILPSLTYAAVTPGTSQDVATHPSPPSRMCALLELRTQHLEAELESHDEEAKRSLRAMEQDFHRIKLRYEQQISELEQQLEAANSAAGTKPWMSHVVTLEEELQCVKESHQEKERSLQDQMKSLQQQLKHKAQPGQAEAAFGARIERLNQDLAAKSRTIQELSRTVQRLQKERKNMLSVPIPRPEPRSTEMIRPAGPAKTLGSATAGEEEPFPAAHYERTYQPTVFTDSHISEVVQENEALKQRLDLLERQREREKEALKADVVQAKEELCRLKENSADQLSSMKAEHLRVLNQLRATHALEHSSSKVAEVANKLNTQEIMVKHLQDQLKEVKGAKEALVISRTREEALQKQLTRLRKELKEAKEAQSPGVKLMCSLERKILNLELRHQHREEELQQVIGGSLQSEQESWKHLAQDKARELRAFRLELDSILDILKHLQRQGVVLPTPDLP